MGMGKRKASVLEKYGFEDLSKVEIESVIVSVFGMEGTGKTSFALTAPKPIALIDFDMGLKRAKKTGLGKDVALYKSFPVGDVDDFQDKVKAIKFFSDTYKKFLTMYKDVCESGEVRTVVFDTATAAWQLLQLSMFGRAEKILPLQYTGLYKRYEKLVEVARQNDVNLVLVHGAKYEYETILNPKTGKPIIDKFTQEPKTRKTDVLARQGNGRTGFLVDIEVGTSQEKGEYRGEIVKACDHGDLVGDVFIGDDINFAEIVAECTGTETERWQ